MVSYLQVVPFASFSTNGLNGTVLVPGTGPTALPAVPPKALFDVPKPLVVPVPPAPNKGFCWLDPNTLLVLLLLPPNPPNAEVVALPPLPKVVPLLLPNALLLPNVVFVFGVVDEPPKRPPEVFVVAPKGVAGFAAPNNDVVVLLLLLFPKPAEICVSCVLPKPWEAVVAGFGGRELNGGLGVSNTRSAKKFIAQDPRPLLREWRKGKSCRQSRRNWDDASRGEDIAESR